MRYTNMKTVNLDYHGRFWFQNENSTWITLMTDKGGVDLDSESEHAEIAAMVYFLKKDSYYLGQ